MKPTILIALTGLTLLATAPVFAQGSVNHLSAAAGHSSEALAHGVVGTAKLASGVVAVPLLVVGAVGAASTQTGAALMDEAAGTRDGVAHAQMGEPLPITDETITAGPSPAQALREVQP